MYLSSRNVQVKIFLLVTHSEYIPYLLCQVGLHYKVPTYLPIYLSGFCSVRALGVRLTTQVTRYRFWIDSGALSPKIKLAVEHTL